MTHTYKITGMTCSSYEEKVKNSLLTIPTLLSVIVNINNNTATAVHELQQVLGGKDSKYQISVANHNEIIEQTKSWFTIYKPILFIFLYINIDDSNN